MLGVAVLVHRHRGGPVGDEALPAGFHPGDVLDQPAEAQLAHGGGGRGLLVGEPLDGVAEQLAVLGQRVQQVGALVVQLRIAHAGTIAPRS